MKHAQTRHLYDYWNRLRAGRDAPERAEIEPGSLRHQLPSLFILDVEEKAQVVYRLAGTKLCEAFGHELRTQDFLEPWGLEDQAALSTMIWSVVDEGAAAVCGWKGVTLRGDRLAFETVLLPLRLDGDRGRRMLGLSAAFADPAWFGVHSLVAAELTAVRMIWPDGAPLFAPQSQPLPFPPLPGGFVRVGHLAVFEGGRR